MTITIWLPTKNIPYQEESSDRPSFYNVQDDVFEYDEWVSQYYNSVSKKLSGSFNRINFAAAEIVLSSQNLAPKGGKRPSLEIAAQINHMRIDITEDSGLSSTFYYFVKSYRIVSGGAIQFNLTLDVWLTYWKSITQFGAKPKNTFVGRFSTPEKQREFEDIDEEVAEGQFENETELVSITMPNVKSIHSSAFKGCSKLQSLILPKVEYIDIDGFMDCNFNDDTTGGFSMPNVQTIFDNAFQDHLLKSISLPNLEVITDGAFNSLGETITYLIIPKAVPNGTGAARSFNPINENTTSITIKKGTTDEQKDRLFGKGNWSNIRFTEVQEEEKDGY